MRHERHTIQHHFRRALAELPLDDDAMVERNLRLIRVLARPETVLAVITDVLNDPGELAAVARRSYRHVNHFDKIVLVDSAQARSYRLTVHMWRPPYTEMEIREELIHDHRFSFWSSILTGSLASENFARENDGAVAADKTYQMYRYVPERLGDATTANFYSFSGEATLTAPTLSIKRAGEAYYLFYERIHRVLLPESGLTATLVLRGPRERSYSNIFNTTYPTYDLKMGNRFFGVEELAERLTALATSLRQEHPTVSSLL